MDDAIAEQQKQQQTLQALQKQLEQAQAEEKQEQASHPDDGTIFGFTPAALILGLIVSTLGLALLRYARVTVQWSFAVVGLALMTIPFFITDAVVLGVVTVVVVGGLLIFRRLSGASSADEGRAG